MSYPINMKFGINQVKGNMETDGNDSDLISFVDFNDTGEFLATGDKAGRVVIFRREDDKNKTSRYIVYCTFTSHDPEFDYLKSLEIEEKINCIRWVPQINYARFLLTTNDKTIKLWKTTERTKKTVHDGFIASEENRKSFSKDDLRIPKVEDIDLMVDTTVKRIFSNAHTYHINSLSVNSDQETFLSADDLRINLWNLQITDQSFNIVDLKPPNMEDLVEVITAAKFHPSSCSQFVYSSSRGTIRLCDMRTKALCDQYSMLFEETDDPSNHSFFSEIINSISDLNFDHSGRYLLTRDYLTCKVWDLNMPKGPVETYNVHDFFRNKLCILYENDSIFDKFEAKWSHDNKYILTGSYNYFFHVFERNTGNSVLLESSREVMKQKLPSLIPRKVVSSDYPNKFNLEANQATQEIDVETMDLDHKLMHLSWHPKEPILALAGTSNLYLIDGFEEQCDQQGDKKSVKLTEIMETESMASS